MMDPKLEQLVATRDEVGIERAFFDGGCEDFLVVDWGEEDEEIVAECARRIGDSSLSATRGGDDEADLVITFGDRSTTVRLTNDVSDRHRTLFALNDVLAGAHELRFLVCSHGSDTIGLALLSTGDWQALERQWPDAVAENFLDPRTIPNIIDDLIDDHLPPLAYARFKRMLERNRKK